MQVQGPAIAYRALQQSLGVGWFNIAHDVQFGSGERIIVVAEPPPDLPLFYSPEFVDPKATFTTHNVRLAPLWRGKTAIGVAISCSNEALADFKKWFSK